MFGLTGVMKRWPGRVGRSVRRLGVERLEDRRMLSGVTLVAHGHNSSVDDWVNAMAEEVAGRGEVSESAVYTIVVDKSTGPVAAISMTRNSGPADWEEAVVKIDWSAIAGFGTSTTDVAAAVTDYLLANEVDGRAMFESPVHLLGHGRGASLIGALAEDLGRQGIWVDQATYMDTYPLGGDWGDSGFFVTDNVVFADSYWRQGGGLFLIDGQPVPGAYNTGLNHDVLEGSGYDGWTDQHSDVHLWYHGTIDDVGVVDDQYVDPFDPDDYDWYVGSDPQGMPYGPRGGYGLHFSRIAGGSRTGVPGCTKAWPVAAAPVCRWTGRGRRGQIWSHSILQGQ